MNERCLNTSVKYLLQACKFFFKKIIYDCPQVHQVLEWQRGLLQISKQQEDNWQTKPHTRYKKAVYNLIVTYGWTASVV
jgi:hypothetical protein